MSNVAACFEAQGERQTFGGVFAAELARITGATGFRVATAVCAVLGILAGFVHLAAISLVKATPGYAETLSSADYTLSGAIVAPAAADGIGLFAFCFALYCIAHVSREFGDGTVRMGLMLVPNRVRLMTARMLVWALAAAAAGLVVGVVDIVGNTVAAGDAPDALVVAAQLLISIIGAACVAVVACGISFVFRSSAVGIIVYICITNLVGTLCTSGMMFLPEPFKTILHAINNIMLGYGTSTLATVSTSLTDATSGLTLCIVWAAALYALALFAFKRYSK